MQSKQVPKQRSYKLQGIQIILWTIFFVELAFLFFISLKRHFNRDEIESVHAAWKISSGETIYVDFFNNHHPFFYYLLAPLVESFKENVMVMIAARISIFLMVILIFIFTYKIAKELFSELAAILGLVLLASFHLFIFSAIEIRPEVPQTLLVLCSLFFLSIYLQNKSLKALIFSSMALGAAFLFLQTTIFLMFILGILLLREVYARRMDLREGLVYISVFAGTIAPYYLYLVINDHLNAYWFGSWFWNINTVGPERVKVQDIMSIILSSLGNNPIPWFFWVISYFFLKTHCQKLIGTIALFYVAFLVLIFVQFPQHFMIVIPLVAIMAGHAISQVFLNSRRWVIIAIILISIVPPINLFFNKVKNAPNTNQLEEMRYVLSITKPTDFVYDGSLIFNLFRNDFDFIWFWSKGRPKGYEKKAEYYSNIYKLIDQFKPKVITKYKIHNLRDPRIANYYEVSKNYSSLLIRTKDF